MEKECMYAYLISHSPKRAFQSQYDIAQNAIVFRDMYLQCPFNQRAA